MHLIDWIIVVAYLLLSLFIGLKYRASAGKSLSDYFLGGRNIPWYIAGISMVATTFAADTPLWVTERIAQNGISGNWLWWNMLIGGMLTTFFFAQYWRRAEVLTELELIEMRYSGKAAAILRGFKSIYMGLFLNVVIIGWVNAAMIMILKIFFDLDDFDALIAVSGLMVIVAIYSSLSGLTGVVITDTIQFGIAMTACIILAYLALSTEQVGGIQGLKSQLPEWRFDFFPKITSINDVGDVAEVFSVTVGAFLTYGLIQWWASWYPGAEPGGGGYIAQRIMGTKNEKHAIYATLFFQIAHYCLRPWPWIIVGLCSLVLYPDLPIDQAGQGFVFTMKDILPVGLKGLLFVAFLAAYMSTISTQLNWGSSYLTNDLYKRFIFKGNENDEASQKKFVRIGRLFTVLIMLIAVYSTSKIHTIDAAVKFLIECGAGLGLVLILRWYYWRINAWSEITAQIAPIIGYSVSKFYFNLEFPESFLYTTGFATISWITVTYLTPAEDHQTLLNFYKKVRPSGNWKPFYEGEKASTDIKYRFISWISAIVMTYCTLFFIGYLIFQEWQWAFVNFILLNLALFVLLRAMRKIDIFES